MGRRISEKVKLGISFDYGETTLGISAGHPILRGFTTDNPFEVNRLSLLDEYDRRDDSIYPTLGCLGSVHFTKGFNDIADGIEYEKAVLSVGAYRPVFDQGIFAANATFCWSSQTAPIFDSCALGAVDSFRGFEKTEFIDEKLILLQAEYRGQLGKRLGYVAFAGVAVTGATPGDALDSAVRSAAGAGLRLRLSRKFPVDYEVDLSVDKRDENQHYVSVGQRF